MLQTLKQVAREGRNLSNGKSLEIKMGNNASAEMQCILYCLKIRNHSLENRVKSKAIPVRKK